MRERVHMIGMNRVVVVDRVAVAHQHKIGHLMPYLEIQ